MSNLLIGSAIGGTATDLLQPRDAKRLSTRIARDAVCAFRYVDPVSNALSDARAALANPETIKISNNAEYALRGPLGLSHEIPQYIRTKSREISFDLVVSWFIYLDLGLVSTNSVVNMLSFQHYFESLVVPADARYAPARVEVSMPRAHLAFGGFLKSVGIDYRSFSDQGDPLEYVLSLSFVEAPYGLMVRPVVAKVGIGSRASQGWHGAFPSGPGVIA